MAYNPMTGRFEPDMAPRIGLALPAFTQLRQSAVQPQPQPGMGLLNKQPEAEQTGFDPEGAMRNIYGAGGPGDALVALGAGLMTGRNVGQGLLQGLQTVQSQQGLANQREMMNARLKALQAKASQPDYATVTAGGRALYYDKNNPQAGASPIPGIPDAPKPQTGHWASPEEVPQNLRDKPVWIGPTGEPEVKGQTPTTNINTNPGPTKDVFETVSKRSEDARSAAQSLPAIQEARKLVDSGNITLGAGADTRLAMQKVGALFGLDPTAAQNTETFRSSIAPIVLSMVKSLGANASNTDRIFAEQAAGGNISLEPGSIKQLLDIGERAARSRIDTFNKMRDMVYPENDPNNAQVRALFGIDVPTYSAPTIPALPAQGANPGWRIKGR